MCIKTIKTKKQSLELERNALWEEKNTKNVLKSNLRSRLYLLSQV